MLFLLQTETVLKQVENVGTLLGAIGLILSLLILAVVYFARQAAQWQKDYIKLAVETTVLIKTVDEKLEINSAIRETVNKMEITLEQTLDNHGKSLDRIRETLERIRKE